VVEEGTGSTKVGGRPKPPNVEIKTFSFEAAIAIDESEVVEAGRTALTLVVL
jgi:hypothetical protein